MRGGRNESRGSKGKYIYIFFFFLTEKKTVHRFEKFKKKKSGVLSMVLV